MVIWVTSNDRDEYDAADTEECENSDETDDEGMICEGVLGNFKEGC